MKPKVSVIIVNYNTFELTCRCIESVFQKTAEVHFEIILVDNASTERDPSAFQQRFPSIKLIKSEANLGFARGNNLGLQHARGEFVLLLNSDTELLANDLKIAVDFMKEHPRTAALTGKLVSPNGMIQHCCQRFPSLWLRFLEATRLHKLLSPQKRGQTFLGPYFKHDMYAEPDWIWGTFFFFRAGILAVFPGNKLDDDFFMYVEDLAWCYRIRKSGATISFLPQIEVLHLSGASGAEKNEMMTGNFNRFLKKHYSPLAYRFLRV